MGYFFTPYGLKVFGADMYAGTAGNGTTTIDINLSGSSMFTTKPYINGTNTSGLSFSADSGINSQTNQSVPISVDIDTVAGTPIVDLYVNLFVAPFSDTYLN